MQYLEDSTVGVRLAVVMPVFKHPEYMVEAIYSVLENSVQQGVALVMVNDGCPFEDTDTYGLMLQSVVDGRFHYLRQKNSGLSAARNTGINYALSRFPNLEGVYFLDADNRLGRDSIRCMLDALESQPDADWFYPGIVGIGLQFWDRVAGRYSALLHANHNLCEAGSLVRTRVFLAGIRFDENMKRGYEDWDFWLQALEKGFRGQHLEEINFRYRKRGESMLSNSDRHKASIVAYMYEKHPWLQSPKDLYALGASEADRYAILVEDGVYTCSDPCYPKSKLSFDEFIEKLLQWIYSPAEFDFPQLLVSTTEGALRAATDARLLRWLLWDCEYRLDQGRRITGATFQSGPQNRFTYNSETLNARSGVPDFLMVSASQLPDLILANNPDWYGRLMEESASDSGDTRIITVPSLLINGLRRRQTEGVLSKVIAFARRNIRADLMRLNSYGTDAQFPDRSQAFRIVHKATGGRAPFPLLPASSSERPIHVAITAPIVDFGGVERVALQMARALKQKGLTPHLVVLGSMDMTLADEFFTVFESINWFPSQMLLGWEGKSYLGTATSTWQNDLEKSCAVGLFSQFDCIINSHAPDFHNIAGELRQMGILLFDHQHVVDITPSGQPVGHPFLSLAFNHAYERTLTCSYQLTDWLRGQGVPDEKLLTIQNGPGCTITEGAVRSSLSTRLLRLQGEDSRPLRVLYMGRLDYQKGVDRLEALLEATADNPGIRWKIVGKAILGDAGDYPHVVRRVSSPVYASEEVIDLYEWADIMILPSRYEGLPLAVIEALKMGVVVVAANVGAIAEVIQHEQNGFIFGQDDFVEDCLRQFEVFLASRESLVQVVNNAAIAGRAHDWDERIEPLSQLIRSRVLKEKSDRERYISTMLLSASRTPTPVSGM